MKKLLSLVLIIITLSACASVPPVEPKVITVHKTIFLKGIPVIHPPVPSQVIISNSNPEIYTITPETMTRYYVAAISKSDISPELKKQLISDMLVISNITESTKPFTMIGLSVKEYGRLKDTISDLTFWNKKTVLAIETYRDMDAYLLPKFPLNLLDE